MEKKYLKIKMLKKIFLNCQSIFFNLFLNLILRFLLKINLRFSFFVLSNRIQDKLRIYSPKMEIN
jgi:hypothetical protein